MLGSRAAPAPQISGAAGQRLSRQLPGWLGWAHQGPCAFPLWAFVMQMIRWLLPKGDLHSQLTWERGFQAAGETGVEGFHACCQ